MWLPILAMKLYDQRRKGTEQKTDSWVSIPDSSGNYLIQIYKTYMIHNPFFFGSAQDITGDKEDVKRVCKQVMNKAASKCLISKQEATVLLAELDLVHCSETIESVSISNSKQIRKGSDENTNKTFLESYMNRPESCILMSLQEYYHYVRNNNTNKKPIIPNFVEVNGTPKYPVTDDYARHVLVVY